MRLIHLTDVVKGGPLKSRHCLLCMCIKRSISCFCRAGLFLLPLSKILLPWPNAWDLQRFFPSLSPSPAFLQFDTKENVQNHGYNLLSSSSLLPQLLLSCLSFSFSIFFHLMFHFLITNLYIILKTTAHFSSFCYSLSKILLSHLPFSPFSCFPPFKMKSSFPFAIFLRVSLLHSGCLSPFLSAFPFAILYHSSSPVFVLCIRSGLDNGKLPSRQPAIGWRLQAHHFSLWGKGAICSSCCLNTHLKTVPVKSTLQRKRYTRSSFGGFPPSCR